MAPRFALSDLRSVHLRVPDLPKARAFYTDVWGLLPAAEGGTTYLRGTGDDPYLVALSEGDTAILEVTWRADPATDLTVLHRRMIAAGATAEGDIGPRRDPGGGEGFTVLDPAGRRVGIVRGDDRAAPIPGGDHRPLRLAHVNLNCADIDADIAFHQDGMGLELTDRSAIMAFLRCNDDHHAVVLADAQVDTLNHVSFLHENYDGMMRAGGRMRDSGFPIGWGPGRHGPGDNVFLYFVDPFGIVVEHTAEVLQVGDDYAVGGPGDWTWPEGRTDQWGICPPKTAECKAAQLEVPFA